jgi:Spy/CpxP family protein refolding chaperone
MQRSQLELWSAEPHPTPQLYQQLTPQQRSQLVSHLAELILKMVQSRPTPPTSLQTKNHER